jgi:hypothetical protein
MGDGFGRGLLRMAGVTGDTLDLSQKLGGDRPTVRIVLAIMMKTTELKHCNLLKNNLDIESATMLAKIGTEKGIMLSGMRRDQTEAKFLPQSLQPADAILIVSDLQFMAVVTTLLFLSFSKRAQCRRHQGAGARTACGVPAPSRSRRPTWRASTHSSSGAGCAHAHCQAGGCDSPRKTLWAGFVTHANARVSASSSPHASPHTHTNFRRKSARTHVETASPPSENSP